jgi:hypothetical protein
VREHLLGKIIHAGRSIEMRRLDSILFRRRVRWRTYLAWPYIKIFSI